MPEMDGFALVEKIRGNPELSPVTVMMLTSGGYRGDVERCRRLGILFYLYKPVRKRELLSAMLTALGQNQPSSPPSSTQADRRVATQSLQILLVEDNRVNQTVATRLLEKMGHSVAVADNGQAALSSWRRSPSTWC